MSTPDNHTPLEQVVEHFDEGGIKARMSIDEIAAVFNNADLTERNKLKRIIQMIMQQHLRSAGRSVRLLVRGIAEKRHDDALTVLKDFLVDLEVAGDAINEAHDRIKEGAPMLITPILTPESPPSETTDE